MKLSQRILAYTQAHPEAIIRDIAAKFAVPHSVVLKVIRGNILWADQSSPCSAALPSSSSS